MQLGRTVIPWRGRGALDSEDLDQQREQQQQQQRLQGQSGDDSSHGSALEQEQEQERRCRQDELFRRVSEYQKRHCWVYDDKLVGTRGNYDQ